MNAQHSFNKINLTANSAGDMYSLMKIGDDREALFARIVVASIIIMVKFNYNQNGSKF